MSDTEIISRLKSLTFLKKANRDGLMLLLYLTDLVLNSFSRRYRRERREAVAVLKAMCKMYRYIHQVTAATNALIALQAGDTYVWDYWAEHAFWRSPYIPRDQWVNSLFTIILEFRWPHVARPDAYLQKATYNHYLHHYRQGGMPRQTDALYFDSNSRTTVSLTVLARTPAEATCEYVVTTRTLAELLAEAEKDLEVREYLAKKLRHLGQHTAAIWRSLGWTDEKGKRVDRRFRRLRAELKQRGAGMELRSLPQPGFSDASQTYEFEVLFDGARGRKAGIYKPRVWGQTRLDD